LLQNMNTKKFYLKPVVFWSWLATKLVV